jgi:hypothetical protein
MVRDRDGQDHREGGDAERDETGTRHREAWIS